VSILLPISGGNRSARAIVLPVEHSVSWHDGIQMKRSVEFVMPSACCS